MKKIINVLMACIVLALATPAYAITPETSASNDISPFYIGTVTASTALWIEPNGSATCSGDVYLKPGYTGKAVLSIQQRISGNWETQASWSEQGKPSVTLSKTYIALSGFEYKTILTVNVFDSQGNYVETVSVASTVVPF